LTKPVGYKKKASRFSSLFKYKQYPIISEKLQSRYQLYNDTLNYIEKEKEQGTTFLIQPSKPLSVSRIEKNQQRLIELYELGWQDAKNNYEKLLAFLEKNQ
jgi:predicted patatin/cPLA2 family phospholipase